MKVPFEIAGWAQRYQTTLRRHLQQGTRVSLQPAAKLGNQAVALGMEPLTVARLHEQGLMTWVSPGGSHMATPRMFARANAFFSETIVPIEKTHRAARETDDRINRLTHALRRRTVEASTSARLLKRSIIRRQAAKYILKTSEGRHAGLLAKARRLQKHLRHLTRTCLVAQEHDRKRVSRRLYGEIAQTLLAINLRMLLLKTMARANTKNLTKEIASTQRMVKQFVRKVEGFTHEFGLPHGT